MKVLTLRQGPSNTPRERLAQKIMCHLQTGAKSFSCLAPLYYRRFVNRNIFKLSSVAMGVVPMKDCPQI